MARGEPPHWTILDNSRWATKRQSDQIDFNEALDILEHWRNMRRDSDNVSLYTIESPAGDKHNVYVVVRHNLKRMEFCTWKGEIFTREW